MSASLPPQLLAINRPEHLDLRAVSAVSDLLDEMRGRQINGNDGPIFFGTAFIQGGRVQFTTAMPFDTLLKISEPNRSERGGNIDEVGGHANRAVNPTHGKKLREYLMTTACVGDQFILPAFTMNWGIDLPDTEPSATMLVYTPTTDDGALTWPALLILPKGGVKMSITDGSHRWEEGHEIAHDRRVAQDQRNTMLRNGVDVKVVFESSQAASHQDFADCGKARPIERSMMALFDIRDLKNAAAKALVEACPLLRRYVDATVANVNLSGGSKHVWSMAAVRAFVLMVTDGHPHFRHQTDPQKPLKATADAAAFFNALTKSVPQFSRLMDDADEEATPANLRGVLGGDVLMRSTGMIFLACAFIECAETGIGFEQMAQRLGEVQWGLLDCERNDGLIRFNTDHFAEDLNQHVLDTWRGMVAIHGNARYRIFATQEDAKLIWKQKLMPKMFPERALAEAAE